MRVGLVRAYEKRGMEIAKSVFSNDIIDLSDATDILETINSASSVISGDGERLAYADLMLEVMLRPDPEMKEWLSMLSQGYFAYHALGLEPRCSQERLSMARQGKWILDSSVLLPILAVDCLNHLYAKDLVGRMKNLELYSCTTERLFDEVLDHAWWAIKNFENVQPYSPDFLQAAVAAPPYKQNLFIDGFVKWSFSQGVPNFKRYITECLGEGYMDDLRGCIKGKLEEFEIEVLDFTDLEGFSENSWFERDAIAAQIEELRIKYGTYRGEAQCAAEAEVVLLSKDEKATFLSQSTILDRLSDIKPRITWKPEAMYRFLSLFSSAPTESDLLHDCMMQDFYYSRFDIVDKRTVSQYMESVIRQARMELDQEKERYERALGKKEFVELRDEFERVPDEQKPFYSIQFAFHVATREREKREAAEARAKQAEEAKRITDREREELVRLRLEKTDRQKKAEKRRRSFESVPRPKKKRSKKKG